MRILFLGLNYPPEEIGIALYSGDMLRDWAIRDHKVSAIVAHPYYPAWRTFAGFGGGWRRELERGVDVTRCPIYVPSTPTGLKRVLHHASFAASSFVPLLSRARELRPDVVFTVAPSLIAAPIALLAAKATGARSWLHIQDFEVEAAFSTGLLDNRKISARLASKFERHTLRSFDIVSTISPEMRAKLISKGVKASCTHEIRNWADIPTISDEHTSPYRDEWGIKTPHVALYSGNIANKQGIEIIVSAAKILQDRKDLTFVICGNGPNRTKLDFLTKELHNVQIHDLQPRERLGELLSLATVHLLPQLADASDLVMPSKLTNMLASGRPIVATAIEGSGLHREIEGCGISVPPGSVNEFSDAIKILIEKQDLRMSLGRNSRARANERWSKSSILNSLSTAIEQKGDSIS